MSYGTDLGITLPTVSVTPGPTYATQINSALQSLINVLEAKVTPSGMDISSDLSFKSGVNYSAALNLERANFENKDSAISAATFPIGLYVVGGELYYNDNSGNQVQVTSDGAVNVSSVSGITGSGYGSGSVEVNWDSTNVAYRMRSGASADDFADVVVDDVILNDGSGHYMTVGAPSLSADASLTLPTLPAADAFLQVDSLGSITASNTMSQAAVFSSTVQTGALTSTSGTFSGDVTVSGDLIGGIRLFHDGEVIKYTPAFVGYAEGGTFVGSFGGWYANGGSESVYIPISTTNMDSISSVLVSVDGASTGSKNIELKKVDGSTGAVTTVASTTSTTSGFHNVTMSGLAENGGDYFYVSFTSSSAGDVCNGVTVTYSRPY